MIRLDIQPYCSDCYDFDPDVIKPSKMYDETGVVIATSDTVVRCSHAKRCEAIKRYLDQKFKEGH